MYGLPHISSEYLCRITSEIQLDDLQLLVQVQKTGNRTDRCKHTPSFKTWAWLMALEEIELD